MCTRTGILTSLLLCSGTLTLTMCNEAETTAPATTQQTKNDTAKTETKVAAPLSFHESWSEQHRADLLRMHRMLKIDVPATMAQMATVWEALTELTPDTVMNEAEMEKHFEEALAKECSMADRMAIRLATQPMLDLLKETAAAGRGDVYGKDGISLAFLAIRLGMPEPAKELVRRGTDPNHRYTIQANMEPQPVYEDLLTAAVGQSPLCESADISPEQSAELVKWLLQNGADPNKSHLEMLSTCCCLEMEIHQSCTCTALILEKLQALPEPQQGTIARSLLLCPGSWETFEQFFRKGLFTQKGIEASPGESIFAALIFAAPPDAPQKTEKLIALGFTPDNNQDRATVNLLIDCLNSLAPSDDAEEQQQHHTRLQCLEVLLRHGATAEVFDEQLPEDPVTKEKVAALLEQYNIPILTVEEELPDEEEDEDDEEYDEESEEE